jgi:hypothetical protein
MSMFFSSRCSTESLYYEGVGAGKPNPFATPAAPSASTGNGLTIVYFQTSLREMPSALPTPSP